jgi:hypothetical protein
MGPLGACDRAGGLGEQRDRVRLHGVWLMLTDAGANATRMARAISGLVLILWAVGLLLSGLLRGVATDGGAYGAGQIVGFVIFPMLVIWLGRRALIKGLAARRLSRASAR